jgi:uncharacterized protein (TIGR03435 family)
MASEYHQTMHLVRMLVLRAMIASLFASIVTISSALPAQAQAAASEAPAAVLPLPATPPDVDASSYKPSLTFDVASVRETIRSSQVDMGIVNPPHKSTFSANSVSLRILIQLAYTSFPFQISGGPDWLDNRYFTISAKADPSVDDQLAKLSDDDGRQEKLNMLQAMLADRFHLRAHWETKLQPAYVMTIAKGGLKMQATKLPLPQGGPTMAPTTPTTGVHAHGGPQGIEIDGERFSTRAIALMLSTQTRMPVTDKTGDNGYYDFAFKFVRDDLRDRFTAEDAYPSIPVAAEEQLGLKLDMQKGPVDVMVIDHAESPSEN